MITKIWLRNFRNYAKREFELAGKVVIVGENGSGKSNLLEAVYLLAVGKSPRADSDAEMVRYGEQVASVRGETEAEELKVVLSDGTWGGIGKKFEVNGVGRRMIDFAGRLRVVEFTPRNMELITGAPSMRRKYLDFVLSQTDREYRRCLVSYEKGLRQRNRILENIREGLAGRQQLFFWDRLLIKDGEYITMSRQNYLEKLEKGLYGAVYDKSVISENRLALYEAEEVAAAATLVGPHRDDFWVEMGGKNVSKFASRGEQRMAVMWLKWGERNFLTWENKLPVMLLDDVFSELDVKHRSEILVRADEHSSAGGQVITTTTDKGQVKKGWNIITL